MVNIQQTQNYNQFKHFPSNRPVIANALVKSIKEKNLLSSRPILVTEDFYIVDGQHRLAAARILNVPIYYTVDKKLTEDDIARLNANQKKWSAQDFLNFHVNRGVLAYVFIDKMIKEFKLPIHFLITCIERKKDCYGIFNRGELIIKNEQSMKETIQTFYEIYELCKKICNDKPLITNHSMRALWDFTEHKHYVHSEFLDKCKKYPDKVMYCFSFREAENVKKFLADIFNHKRYGPNKVEFN